MFLERLWLRSHGNRSGGDRARHSQETDLRRHINCVFVRCYIKLNFINRSLVKVPSNNIHLV